MQGGGAELPTQAGPYCDPEELAALLGPNGPLSQALRGFELRPQQIDMLRNVVEAYNDNLVALIEAGTGTGKSLAYLLPAMLWAVNHQERTVISTNTINLQEQLIYKDIPFLKKALGLDLKAVLVKGMGNYLCLRKLDDVGESSGFMSPQEEEDLVRLDAWKQNTKDGSRSTLNFVPQPDTWERVRSEADQCSGSRCPYYEDCYFFKARQRAANAQILVVNHHLLFADLSARIETQNYKQPCVLPAYQRVVVDEAHHMEDVATEYFASRVSQRKLGKILTQFVSDGNRGDGGKLAQLLERIAKEYPKDPPQTVAKIVHRLSIDLPSERTRLTGPISKSFEALTNFMGHAVGLEFGKDDPLAEAKLRIKQEHRSHVFWKERVVPAIKHLYEPGKSFVASIRGALEDIGQTGNERLVERVAGLSLDINALCDRFDTLLNDFSAFAEAEEEEAEVRWAETFKRGRRQDALAVRARLDIDTTLARHFFTKFKSIVLCSATLSTNRDFSFIRQRLGLRDPLLNGRTVTEHIYDSPFNYPEQALLCVPTDMPEPKESGFLDAAAKMILRAVDASHGNAFVLFTSYQMLNACHRKLKPQLDKRRMLLLKQGEDSRGKLLSQFVKQDRSVLFGTDSFWEGVDVAGEALRCVVIVKLPFQVPSEPIVEARSELLTKQGRDPFMHYSVPNATVKFKQGFGRLIRKASDRGCIVCLDRRLIGGKGYGKVMLNSLPNCSRYAGTQDNVIEAMRRFYRSSYKIVKGNGA